MIHNEETWKLFEGVPEKFEIEVSSHGRVRHHGYYRKYGLQYIWQEPGPINPFFNITYPYPRVFIRRNGKRKQFKVHLMVLETFVGPRPSPDHVGGHLNDIPWDNHLSNLEWITRKENSRQAVENMNSKSKLCPGFYESNFGRPKFSPELVKELRSGKYDYLGNAERIAEAFKVSQKTIRSILDYKTFVSV
jgi:hypothetical protein